jgi:site-specific DNA-methyltransferase (adenine-specific)
MQIELIDPRQLTPYPDNPRDISDAVAPVLDSIRRFGFRKPIVADRAGVIIAGHVRHQAALALGLSLVPVHYADLPEQQARAYRLADNRTAELAEWDTDALIDELLELRQTGDLPAAGFTSEELAALLQSRTPATDDEWSQAIDDLTSEPPTTNQQTFSLTPEQHATVIRAVHAAIRQFGGATDANRDATANAVARIAEDYLR